MGKIKFDIHPTITVKRSDEPKILDEIREKCQVKWNECQPLVPEMLYHYTSAEGMLGILSSKSIWFTHVDYFEDKSEGEYGRKLILNFIEELYSNSLTKKQDAFLEDLKRHYEESWDFFQDTIYITSFCSNEDVLSQWERFANKGYCLGFKFSKKTYFGYLAANTHNAIGMEINKVIYDEDEQRSLIKPLLNELLKLLKGNDDIYPSDCTSIVSNYIDPWLYYFKNKFFKDENEWRFITNLRGFRHHVDKSHHSHVSFRTNNGAIIPYISLLMINNDFEYNSKFPLSKIYRGPTLNDYDSKSIEYVLSKYRLPSVEIKNSMIPVRKA